MNESCFSRSNTIVLNNNDIIKGISNSVTLSNICTGNNTKEELSNLIPIGTRVPYSLSSILNNSNSNSINHNKKKLKSDNCTNNITTTTGTTTTTTTTTTIPTTLTSQSSFSKRNPQDPIKQAIVLHCKLLTSLYRHNKIDRCILLEQLNILFDKLWVDYNLRIIENVPIEKISKNNLDTSLLLKDSKTLVYLLKNPQYLYTLLNNNNNNNNGSNSNNNNNNNYSSNNNNKSNNNKRKHTDII